MSLSYEITGGDNKTKIPDEEEKKQIQVWTKILNQLHLKFKSHVASQIVFWGYNTIYFAAYKNVLGTKLNEKSALGGICVRIERVFSKIVMLLFLILFKRVDDD